MTEEKLKMFNNIVIPMFSYYKDLAEKVETELNVVRSLGLHTKVDDAVARYSLKSIDWPNWLVLLKDYGNIEDAVCCASSYVSGEISRSLTGLCILETYLNFTPSFNYIELIDVVASYDELIQGTTRIIDTTI